MSLSKVSVENSLKPEKFVKISWVDKLLPNYFSILKYLSITDFSVVKAQSYESLVPVKLLRGVDYKTPLCHIVGRCGFWCMERTGIL